MELLKLWFREYSLPEDFWEALGNKGNKNQLITPTALLDQNIPLTLICTWCAGFRMCMLKCKADKISAIVPTGRSLLSVTTWF